MMRLRSNDLGSDKTDTPYSLRLHFKRESASCHPCPRVVEDGKHAGLTPCCLASSEPACPARIPHCHSP